MRYRTTYNCICPFCNKAVDCTQISKSRCFVTSKRKTVSLFHPECYYRAAKIQHAKVKED